MDQLIPVLAAVAASLVTVLGAQAVARRFQRLGGGEAQELLNSLRKEIVDAMEERYVLLEKEFTGCKARLATVERQTAAQRRAHLVAARRWVVERREFRAEVHDLHDELAKLRPERSGRRDRTTDA